MIEANVENFDSIIDCDYAVVDCYGDFCAACVLLEPVYTAAANDMAYVRFARTNLSEYPEIADRFGINAMPTLLFFRNGKLVHQAIGSMDRSTLNKHLAKMLYQ